MQKRRSHTKSRRGCISCKKKHIRCDELGPPCANCVARSTNCVYPATAARSHDHRRSSTTNSSSTPSSSSASQSQNPRLPRVPSPRLPTAASSSSTSSSSESRRLLELELMHRWTARTYVSLCSIPRDTQTFQLEVPHKALRFDWLLNGLLALAALDMSSTTPHTSPKAAEYARAAVEYYDCAVRSYRRAVADMTLDNHDSLFAVGFVVAVYAVARMQRVPGGGLLPSVLAQVPQFFDLLSGTSMISVRCLAWLVRSMESVRIVRMMEPATAADLDEDARAALARLADVNERLHASPPVPLCSPAAAGGALSVGDAGCLLESNPARDMYARLLPQMVRCFAEDARGLIDGLCLAFPAFGGRDFRLAVERAEPMALLVLMYWAVCLEHHGKKMWWANGVGRRLIVEITEVLERSEAYWIPEFWEAMAWARRRVGLPELLLGSCSYAFDVVEIDGAAQ